MNSCYQGPNPCFKLNQIPVDMLNFAYKFEIVTYLKIEL